MARSDSTIRYSIEVDGAPSLKSVAEGLSDIAVSGEPAADQATKLLEELKHSRSRTFSLTNSSPT